MKHSTYQISIQARDCTRDKLNKLSLSQHSPLSRVPNECKSLVCEAASLTRDCGDSVEYVLSLHKFGNEVHIILSTTELTDPDLTSEEVFELDSRLPGQGL